MTKAKQQRSVVDAAFAKPNVCKLAHLARSGRRQAKAEFHPIQPYSPFGPQFG
jgi:hypothetical protein